MAGQRRHTSFLRSAIAGFMAAGSATVVFHPLDTIKTVLQHGRGGSGGAPAPAPFPGVAAAGGGGRSQSGTVLTAAVRDLGLRGLWRGVVPAGISMSAACAVRMGAYEVAKSVLLRDDPSLPWARVPDSALVAASSAAAVVISAVARAPLDMVKVQMQVAGAKGGSVAALQAAWSSGGVRGFYRGAGLGLMRDVPFFTINLVLYEQFRLLVRGRAAPGQAHELTTAEAMATGAAAQGFAGFVTNPVDVLKTRVQASDATGPGRVAAALRNVLREAGPFGLMRGALMRTIWIAPQGMVYYPVYEFVQQLRL